VYSSILKYIATSAICALTDIGLFTLLARSVFRESNNAALYSYIVARICSGLLNYVLKKFVVFEHNDGGKWSAVKFIFIFICNMALSAGVTQALSILPFNLTLIKILVDSMLFILCYAVQKYFVFAASKRIQERDGL
jgi:putative flippase GtrA